MNRDFLEQHYRNNEARFLDQLKELLRHQSISTDPAYHERCVGCVEWLRAHVATMGFSAEIVETPGKPLLFAELPAPAGKPTVLFYGHYDVQPVDPLELWETPPFEPVIVDGRIRARGAQDNKGQLFYVLKAIETLREHGGLQCGVKLIIEGEEECGSLGIQAVLERMTPRLRADTLLVCDTGTLDPAFATITMGLRGIIHLEATLRGPKHDLHSGVYGGVVANPANQLARIVASLHDDAGRIAVPGFFDTVEPLSDADRALALSAPIPLEKLSEHMGVPFLGGERKLPALQRRSFEPTIDVNGFHSGYGGAGGKTIIPAQATVKLSSRLVAGQDPERALEQIVKHLESQPTNGLTLSIEHAAVGGGALKLSSASPAIETARRVLIEMMGNDPIFMWEGASIPFIPKLAAACGGEPVFVGFGLEDDRIHAPNESFSIEQFRKGFVFAGLMLSALGSK